MRNKILFILLLCVGFLVFTVIFTVLMFPTDTVKTFVEKTAEKTLKQDYSVSIQELSLGNIDITAKHVVLRPRQLDLNNFADQEGQMIDGFYCVPYIGGDPIVFDEVMIDPALTTLSGKKPEANFSIKAANGTILGELATKDESYKLELAIKDIALQAFTLLSNITATQLYGALSAEGHVVLGEANSIESGKLTLRIMNTVMCPKRIEINMSGIPYFEIPFTRFGNVVLDISIENKNIKINKLLSDGPDIQLDGTGNVRMKSDRNPNPSMNLELKILPGTEWMETNSMEMVYSICRRQDDGSIDLKLRGSLKSLKKDCGKPIPVEIPPKAEADKTAPEPTPKEEVKGEEKSKSPEKPKENADKNKDIKKKVGNPARPPREQNEQGEAPKRRGVPVEPDDAGRFPPPPPKGLGSRHAESRPDVANSEVTRLRPEAARSLQEEDEKAWEATIGRRGQRIPRGEKRE